MYVSIYKQICYNESAHMILEAEKSPVCHLQAGAPGELWCGLRADSQRAKVDSSPVWRPENREGWGQEKIDIPAPQSGREQIQPSSAFLFYLGPQQVRWGPPTPGRAICFALSTNSNADLFGKRSHGHTQEKCLTSNLGILWSSQVDL